MTLNDLLLPVQRQMVDPLAYDHLRQQTGSGRALFDRLGGLVAVFTVEAHAYFLHTFSITVSCAGMYS